jgi:hypothetical protein
MKIIKAFWVKEETPSAIFCVCQNGKKPQRGADKAHWYLAQ